MSNDNGDTTGAPRQIVLPGLQQVGELHFVSLDCANELDGIEDATPTQRALALLLRGQAMQLGQVFAAMEQQHQQQRIVRPNIITPAGGFGRKT